MNARQEFDAPVYALAFKAADVQEFDLDAEAAKRLPTIDVLDVLEQLVDCDAPLQAAIRKRDGTLIGRIVLAATDWYARELALIGEYGAGDPRARQTLTLAQVAAMACYPVEMVL